tara:strand:+ start:2128 stop:3288 length:1161 start_codon:yes stop_codon:yes gene_type:complete
MFFGATAFGQAPFGAVGEAAQQIIITPASHTITLTLSNAYTVQKTHFVNGFLLNSSVNSVTPQLKPVISGQSVSVALNSPTVTADGTIHLATGGGTLTVTLGSEIAKVAKILQGTTLTSATSGAQSVSGTALPTISGNSLTSSVGNVALGPGITAPDALVSQVAGIPAADTTFVVTVVNPGSGNVFVIDGVQKPTLTMTKGRKYIFDVSDYTNATHPLRFQTTSGVPITDGVVVTGTQGQAGAKVEFTVPFNTFETIRYYCSTHGAAMGNSIDIKGLKVKLAPVVAVTGTSMSSAVNGVTPKLDVFATGTSSSLATSGVNFGYALTVSGNSLTTAVGTLSVFTFSDVDDTTTATIPLTPVDTTGAGGSSWTEVDESGAGTIEGEAA